MPLFWAGRILQYPVAHPCNESLPKLHEDVSDPPSITLSRSTRAKCRTFIYMWNVFNTVGMDMVSAWHLTAARPFEEPNVDYSISCKYIYIYTKEFLLLKKKKYKTCFGINTRYKMQQKTQNQKVELSQRTINVWKGQKSTSAALRKRNYRC